MRLAILCLLACAVLTPLSQAQAAVFVITPEQSTIKFYVKSSVDIEGHFDKWDATLTFTSPKISTGVLDIKIQEDSGSQCEYRKWLQGRQAEEQRFL
jgi:polyisoprenoid-binding protein YceI